MIIGEAIAAKQDGTFEQRTYSLIEGKLVITVDTIDSTGVWLIGHHVETPYCETNLTEDMAREIIYGGHA